MKDKIELVRMWIKKAENDLITAKHSMTIKPLPPFDTICFHAQQCAEKYLKAYLTYNEVDFEKTHDIGDLITLASQIDNSFSELLELGDTLTPYAVRIRYPIFEEISEEKAKEAIRIAEEIKELVLKHLPELGVKND